LNPFHTSPTTFQNLMKLIFTLLTLSFTSLLSLSLHGEEFALEPQVVANLRLQFEEVTQEPVDHPIRAAGSVRLNEKKVFEVTPRIEGMIITDPLSLGDTVKKGDVLCTLQSATLAEMITNYVSAEEEMRFAGEAALQERKLADKKLSSAEQLREKENALKQAVAAHSRALQPLKLLDFNEGSIHKYLTRVESSDYTTLEIAAPEAGEIITKDLRRGAAIDHDHELFVIADLSEVWVDFQIALRDAASLAAGDHVVVESSITQTRGDATILYVAPIADDQTRTVMARASLSNPDHSWRPGTPVNVLGVSSSEEASALSVPAGAVVDYDDGKAVFVKQDGNAFAPVPVTIGRSDGKRIEILEGLASGQTVVSRNSAQLKGHLEMTASK